MKSALLLVVLFIYSYCGSWSTPVNLGPSINTAVCEENADYSYANHIYFERDGDIYYSEKTGTSWSSPVYVNGINSSSFDTSPSLSSDENTMYFCSDRPGGYGDWDIYKSTKVGSVWQTPINLGPTINTEAREAFVRINKYNSLLYFSRMVSGNYDIYESLVIGSTYGIPNPISEINTSEDEMMGDIANGEMGMSTMYYTYEDNYTGGSDIYIASYWHGWTGGIPFSEINTSYKEQSPTISPNCHNLIFVSDRPGGLGGFDLWETIYSSEAVTPTSLGVIKAGFSK